VVWTEGERGATDRMAAWCLFGRVMFVLLHHSIGKTVHDHLGIDQQPLFTMTEAYKPFTRHPVSLCDEEMMQIICHPRGVE
jgi:hypothetical protein